jgi:hypothetical protein
MDLSTTSVMAAKDYLYKAESLVKEYLLADSYVSYTAVLGGILMCKMVSFVSSYFLIFIMVEPVNLVLLVYLDGRNEVLFV